MKAHSKKQIYHHTNSNDLSTVQETNKGEKQLISCRSRNINIKHIWEL
jgi:hypothetical protein